MLSDQAASSAGAQSYKPAVSAAIAFDIPPQSLLTALRAYSEATGQAVLVDNTLTAERQSPGVRGEFDKIEALQRLLAGTGLVASYSSEQAFTLKLAEPGEPAATDGREKPQAIVGEGIQAVTERYAGTIQQPIEAALCQSDQTRPGTYRLAMQIWVTPSGKVARTSLLTPMDSTRGNRIRAELNELVLQPPPAGMPQPITLLLLPNHDAGACAGAASSQG